MPVVEITQSYIDLGTPKSSQKCPVALGIRRRYPNPRLFISVGTNRVMFWDKEDRDSQDVDRDLPEEAKQFIDAFDRGEPVKPFKFYMQGLPDDLTEIGTYGYGEPECG